MTALLMASQEGHEEVVRLLLQFGAQDVLSQVRPSCAQFSQELEATHEISAPTFIVMSIMSVKTGCAVRGR